MRFEFKERVNETSKAYVNGNAEEDVGDSVF
jgi:hypothetical protein